MITDNIDVGYFTKYTTKDDFLGFLPTLEDNYNYYSVQNEHPNAEFKYVVPVYGKLDNNCTTDLEFYYLKPELDKKARGTDKAEHAKNRQRFIDNYNNNKYCVFFVGCDDGWYFMRFKDKETAVNFLSTIEFFDEIYQHKDSMMW